MSCTTNQRILNDGSKILNFISFMGTSNIIVSMSRNRHLKLLNNTERVQTSKPQANTSL